MNKNMLKKYISGNSVILDAGAFNGNDSIDFANKFPESTVYAIEPVSSIYNGLIKNTEKYDNIKCFKMALDDTVGEKEIYISSGFSVQSSSLMKPKEHLTMFPTCKFNTSEIAKTITINQFCIDNNIDRIDFMWLDLQGNETKVLNNAKDILYTTKAIFAEYSLVEFYEGLTLYEDFKIFMDSLGFKEEVNENLYNNIGCGNSLFVKK